MSENKEESDDAKLAYLLGEYGIQQVIWCKDNWPSPFLFVSTNFEVLYGRISGKAPFWVDPTYSIHKFEALAIKETEY